MILSNDDNNRNFTDDAIDVIDVDNHNIESL